MPTDMEYLKDLIDSYRNYSVEYYMNYTNHLPMAATALIKMGAERERLMDFCAIYSRRLNGRVQSSITISGENWKRNPGQHRYFDAYNRFFRSESDRMGVDTMLHTYLPELMDGIGSGAFHALIKLAYGIMNDDDTEKIEAMAYYAICYLPLGYIQESTPDYAGPEDALLSVKNNTRWKDKTAEGRNIDEKIYRVISDPDFNRYLHVPGDAPVKYLAETAPLMRNIFINSFNFTSLHMVTGTHALRIVLPYIKEEDRGKAVKQFWKTAAAAYLSIGAPEVDLNKDKDFTSQAEWEDIFSAAIKSGDAHVIKLIFTCHEEEKEYNDPLYRYLAEREMKAFK